MILSGNDLQLCLSTGYLIIEPCYSDTIQQNGLDLRLESVADGSVHQTMFSSGGFYLGTTVEWIEMPNDLMAFVELRSTWARHGLMIPPTIVDAGFKGTLTLEIASFTDMPVPSGQRFAHLIFAKTTSPCTPYNGRYQGQRGITGPLPDPAKGWEG